ncbi:glycosyltransferase family 4 protein [Caldilinea sp.]|uniref:glycosyltransferase family 4 protein n=1 Tax=Caldilinea sp. TaxID=2293560 RepID=UPI0021DE8CC4|nr:glycosyltransferase family 4 protein [Caldilinea sp.]GIV71818.1 MAG: glycosyl transferase [Caldilinea sp.]
MNPRVCFVAPFGLGQKTTVWARTLPLARVLATHGWRPTLLIPPWDTPQDDDRRWKDGDVELINIALRGGLLVQLKRLLYEVNSIQPDIIHIVKPRAHAGLVQWWLWRTPRHQRPPILLDADDWEQAWAPINRYPWPLARFLAWQEEWGIRHADGVTVASRWLAETIGRANPTAPLLWLPNGVEPPAPDAPRWRAHAGKDVLFFTRFVEVSPQWLAQFASSLYEKSPGSTLLIAGAPVREGLDRPFRRLLQEAAHPASARIEWLGFVDRTQLAALYNRIGCAIFPAEPTILQQAKCSVRLANTLLAGVPVVASAVGEQAAYGADGAARLVPVQATPEEFAATVAEVLATPAQQRALGETARQRLLKRYDWRMLGAQLHAFYRRILGN